MKVVLSLGLLTICGFWPAAVSLPAQVVDGPGDFDLHVVPATDRLARDYHLDVEKPSQEDRAKLAHDFPTLMPEDQSLVLGYFWPKVRCPEFVAALTPLAQLPRVSENAIAETLCDHAFLRLYDLSPETARPLILDDLKSAKPLLSFSVLLSLPDKELPQLDDVLLANLTNGDTWKVAPIIERYATARIMPQVVAYYQQSAEQGWACSLQTAFLRYWLKHDRPAALQAIEKAVNLRKSTGCYKSVLGETLHDSFYPDAEALARKYAGDPDPEVAAGAKSLLDQHPPIPDEIR
jgi:hypothetical protein